MFKGLRLHLPQFRVKSFADLPVIPSDGFFDLGSNALRSETAEPSSVRDGYLLLAGAVTAGDIRGDGGVH